MSGRCEGRKLFAQGRLNISSPHHFENLLPETDLELGFCDYHRCGITTWGARINWIWISNVDISIVASKAKRLLYSVLTFFDK